MSQQAATSRTLPHNLEAEQSVLSCILIDNDSTISVFAQLTEDDFYSPGHKVIYVAMKTLYDKGNPVDFVTLVSHLDAKGLLDKVGGISYISTVNDAVPSAANFRHYVEILVRNRTLRKLIVAANSIISDSVQSDDAHTSLQAAERAIFDIGKANERRELTEISKELPGVLDRFDAIQRNPELVRGLRTGFYGLDNLTNGLQKSDLVIVAARPSVGKTALGMNIVLNAATKYKAKCAVFSLEMSKQSMATRALCTVAKVSNTKAQKGDMNADEWSRLWQANKVLSEAEIYVDDNSSITPAEIARKCMRLKREKGGLDLVMIDYLGLMTSGSSKRESRQVEVSDNSRLIKILAKDLDVPILLLSQLNRGIEARKGLEAKPVLSDLRESGAIEQDADIVMFIHKEKNEDGTHTDEAEIIVAKHRNGPLGNIKLGWVGDIASFTNQGGEQKAQEVRDKIADRAEPKQPESTPESKAKKKDAGKKDGEEVKKGVQSPANAEALAAEGLLDVF